MTPRLWRLFHLFVVAWSLSVGHDASAQTTNKTDGGAEQILELQDPFGVDYPDQIVEFTLHKPATPDFGTVCDEAGHSVPFQILDGGARLALQTNLPANARKLWRWNPNDARAHPNRSGVEVIRTGDLIEISNDLIAFRVPTREYITSHYSGSKDPNHVVLTDLFNVGPRDPRVFAPAPIQGIRFVDHSWSAEGPNILVARAQTLVSADVDVVEAGPLKAAVEIRYLFDKQEYLAGTQKVSDPGHGYLTVRMTLVSGHSSILFEEETNLDEVWAMNVYNNLEPNQAQYKGHHASAAKFGHLSDGSVYPPSHLRNDPRGAPDAIVNVEYQRPRPPSYVTTDDSWSYLPIWNPWSVDTGWYWQLYNTAGGEHSNILSLFAGPASRATGTGMSGASVFTLPSASAAPERRGVAGISSQSYRRAPDARLYPYSRFSWGLFLGSKGKDLNLKGRVPTVQMEANTFGGPVTLTKLAAMKFDFPSPPRGDWGLYMDKPELQNVIERIRSTKGLNGGFYRRLYNTDTMTRPLIDAWADESGSKMQAVAAKITDLARDLVDEMVNGKGIYSFKYHYWQGGLEMMRVGLWIDQALASSQLTLEERQNVKVAACLFGYVLWDDDFVPLDNSSGINLGTANMPQQQQGYRYFYAQFLSNHPDFAARARQIDGEVTAQIQSQFNEYGAHFGSPHYISASVAPTLNTLMQIKQLGRWDPFQTETRLAKFARFYLNLLTPPEVRFPGSPRSLIALGNSSTETSPLFGVLGTAFRDADPALSQNLMWAWAAGGKPYSGFFGTNIVNIDDRLRARDPDLGSANFPGYYSVLRSGWNTPDETAAWIVNGDFYQDHRTYDDGDVIIYALGAPLSVHWGSIYYPAPYGAFYHSTVVPEKQMGTAWNQSNPPLGTPRARVWDRSSVKSFSTSPKTDTSVSTFSSAGIDWTRTLQLDHADPATPIILLRDDFEGSAADSPKILTMQLMAHGPVQTPAGEIEPEVHVHPFSDKESGPNQLASAGRAFSLNPGVSRFSFHGQFGVDFDVFVVSRTPQEAMLGNWAVSWTQQSIPKWQESQDLLRIRGTGPFLLAIVPFREGRRPADLNVEIENDWLTLVASGSKHRLVQAKPSTPFN